jgi:probable rRNA maturation factor
VAISFHNEGITFQLKEKNRHKKWIGDWIHSHQKIPGKITYIFTSNELLRLMNREYLNHNYFTDVITFDYTEGETLSGDIFISVDQVILNAGTFDTETNEELRRVMIHGVLHLMGYADRTDPEKQEMRNLENEALLLW